MNICACGCGKSLPAEGKPNRRFIVGHNNRLRLLDDKACEVCGQTYHPLYAAQRYCSRACYDTVRSQAQRKWVQRTCEVCGRLFEAQAHRANARFCSRACWAQRNPPMTKTCPCCGRPFTTYDRQASFCSRSCARKDKTGPKASAWKGGKTLERERTRFSTELQAWRKAVYERDDYTCRQCGARGDLHAHHTKSFADHPELRFDVANGQTLCIPCHEAVHGRKLTTPGQYPKHCIDCGCATSGRSWRCRSCSIAHAHLLAGHRQPRTCPQCGGVFAKRPDAVYCSEQCARAAATTAITVGCAHCGCMLQRTPSQIASRTDHFCSESCQHAHLRQRVTVICPICSTCFEVKPYRLKDGRIPTCSNACSRELIKRRQVASV